MTGSVDTAQVVAARVEQGELIGAREGDVAVFRGVPYARALRFSSPRPAEPWRRRSATEFSRAFVQSADPDSAEDALYANVWTPDTVASLPVLLYIHGGGWQVGAGSVPTFDGAHLAAAGGLVVVNFNYRLSGFGWGLHEDLADPETGLCANWGLQDQAAAIRWVAENIAAFGGDPGNITLCGTSAGGGTAWLLALRAEEMGIRRLISISAAHAAPPATSLTPEDSRRVYESIAAELGTSVAGLRDVPYAAFHTAWLAAFAGDPGSRRVLSGREYRGPIRDGVTMPEFAHVAPTPSIPVMSIHNSTEGSFFTDPLSPSFPPAPPVPVGEAQLVRAVRGVLGKLSADVPAGLAEKCVRAYRAAAEDEGLPSDPRTLWTEVWGDALFRNRIVRLAERHARLGTTPGYVMQFAHPVRAPHYGTPHDATSKFLFGTYSHPMNVAQFGDRPAERRVSTLFMAYVASFARDGVPRAVGAPQWPEFSASRPSTLILGGPAVARVDGVPKLRQLDFWREVP
ncbi:carboxylesterase/lipase family protein [Actinospica sp. MGRD01-02]|uniref:Carboxylic ester hydrolase n=1 Tax=Actinospica acidithermotolerans TaxID=2828514 RepID=A0A941EH72_9ACTN|nr:carboxylesterase family protein [Actinospica acidithermotolerans]MBR7830605.1 carboxylesterase/lipase family protein [Actinospica acidithermotolerans]